MPLKIHCDACRAVLYEGKYVKSPHEIIVSCEGKCPNCHRKLSHIPKTVEVMPVE